MFHRIGWWGNLQETPIFDGKNHGFRLRFSPTNQSSECVKGMCFSSPISNFTGCWFGTMEFWMTFYSVGSGINFPTDELIFFRGVGIPPTSLCWPLTTHRFPSQLSPNLFFVFDFTRCTDSYCPMRSNVPFIFCQAQMQKCLSFHCLALPCFFLIGGLRHIETEKVHLNHPSANTMMTPQAPAVTTGVITGTLWLFNIAMENHHFL